MSASLVSSAQGDSDALRLVDSIRCWLHYQHELELLYFLGKNLHLPVMFPLFREVFVRNAQQFAFVDMFCFQELRYQLSMVMGVDNGFFALNGLNFIQPPLQNGTSSNLNQTFGLRWSVMGLKRVPKPAASRRQRMGGLTPVKLLMT